MRRRRSYLLDIPEMGAPLFDTSILGTGALTPPSIGDTDGNRLTLNNEGLWVPVLAEEVRERGLRRIHNILSFSEDMTQAGYSGLNGGTVSSATVAAYDGTVNAAIKKDVTITDKGAGRTFIFSAKIKVLTGTVSSDDSLQILIRGDAITQGVASIGDEVSTTETKRFVITATTDATGTIVAPEVRWDDAGTLEITEWQLEESTGLADTTTPSEYVSTGVLSTPWHGFNVDAVSYKTTLNANSVTDNVVSESTGASISAATLDGLFCEGLALEASGYSGDIGNWPTFSDLGSATQDAVGLTGAPNEAWTLTDNSAIAVQTIQINKAIVSSTNDRFAVAWIAYDASPSVYPSVYLQLSGGTAITMEVIVDPSDGTTNIRQAGGVVDSSVRIGDFWRLQLSVTDNGTGNNLQIGIIQPAFNTDGSTTQNVAAQGSTIFASYEMYETTWSDSPLLTTGGTTKTRLDDTGYTLDLANWSDSVGSMEFELTPYYISNTGVNQGFLTVNASVDNMAYDSSSDVRRLGLKDGTNAVAFANAWATSGQTIAIKIRWNSTTLKMQNSVDGVAGTETTFDGSFSPSGAITLFKSLTLGASMKNLSIFWRDKGETWLTE